MKRRTDERKRSAAAGKRPVGRGRAATGRENGNGDARRRGVQELLASVAADELREIYRFWGGAKKSKRTDDEMRRRVVEWMSDPLRVEERVAGLGRRLGAVVEDLICAPMFQRRWSELESTRSLSYMSSYDLEACIAALFRRGFVFLPGGGGDGKGDSNGHRIVALPAELAEGLVQQRFERMRGIFGVLTLRGHLDQSYADPSRAKAITPQRLRELYKMYSQEAAIVARIERLPEGVRGLVEKAILEFGGLLPRQLFERMESELPHWNGRRWRMILEPSLIGTVQELDLTRYGIQLRDEALIVFNEVALAWLRKVAVPGDPDAPHEELSLGIDLISNLSRFLDYIDENSVRYTVRGEIFKTTEKKILQYLIPNPGRELSREEVLAFIFRFCRTQGLIDRTGSRTFSVTTKGREWESHDLLDKRKHLLDFALADRRLPGEPFHHERMREIFMRLLKRVEPGVWYDLMYLPFLARNSYLSTLDDLRVEEHFAERSQKGHFPSMEDPQRLAWDLVRWVRQRLYLLGMVDLGYDKSGRPVALRLTSGGARVLGLEGDEGTSQHVGSLVVTPDFEVVLFPTGDDAQLVHDLDRFCVREKHGSVVHFRITQDSVRRALKGGMGLRNMRAVLDAHSRTPVPQNVDFSIADWAARAGLMQLDSNLVLRCEDPEILRRFLQDPGTRTYVGQRLGDGAVKLKGRTTPKRMRAVLRELGYLIELEKGS